MLSKDTLNKIYLVLGLVLILALLNFFPDQPANYSTTSSADRPKTPTDQVLIIPKINAWTPIVYLESSDPLALQLELAHSVVHQSGTAQIGQIGNAYILGDQKGVFADLEQLKKGDPITVVDPSGQTIFRVFATYFAASDNAANIAQDTRGRRLITLQQAPAIGSDEKRFTVVAEISN